MKWVVGKFLTFARRLDIDVKFSAITRAPKDTVIK